MVCFSWDLIPCACVRLVFCLRRGARSSGLSSCGLSLHVTSQTIIPWFRGGSRGFVSSGVAGRLEVGPYQAGIETCGTYRFTFLPVFWFETAQAPRREHVLFSERDLSVLRVTTWPTRETSTPKPACPQARVPGLVAKSDENMVFRNCSLQTVRV